MTQFRAQFDATITFLNGGGLQTQGFLLDVRSEQVEDTDLALALVRHLGLLMVEDVSVSNVRVVPAAHRGSRGTGGPAASPGRLIDLSHVIREGMVTYPGLPGPEFRPYLSREDSKAVYADGTQFTIDRISMLGNTGTYLDSPHHRYDGGTDLAGLHLEQLADLPISVGRLDGSTSRGIAAAALAALDVAGRAVLLQTGWDRHFGTEAYAGPAPYLTEDGARYLVEHGAALVGIDSVNIDDTAPTSGGRRPAHSLLLAAGIPVLEHLTALADVPADGARLHAVPPKVAGFGTFPVRAYAVVRPD
ncbi:Kynurenine formamidase [Nakamurella panacisegetis]|uniref:Kynurenine formamidase n=1 Tax=Nakamurella panacisegetis TaxID=1090615 RepID=A0A1H0J0K7_9ACTN|nr:cyclase family protein [Nakamurella panacisegetis]SDO37010.1 Kynurenine formamidase [Nakamurella panacisegetis]